MKYQAYVDEEKGNEGNLCVLELGAQDEPTAGASYIINAVGKVGKRVNFSPMLQLDKTATRVIRARLNDVAQRIDLTKLTNRPQEIEAKRRDEEEQEDEQAQ